MNRRLALTLAAAMLVLAPATAPALTLMVNGDTPSARWQRAAERGLMPLPAGVLSLRFSPCPYSYGDATGVNVSTGACINLSAAPRTIYIDPALPSYEMRRSLFHEIGHAFDADRMTDGARLRFARIWRRPALAWDAELALQRQTVLGPEIGTSGITSTAQEWFADAYAACSIDPIRVDGDAAGELSLIPWGRSFRDALFAERKLRATCALIRRVAATAS